MINIIVYKITCKINNKVYVGQTCETLKQRFSRHMGYQKDQHDTKFYRAVRKYGVDNFYIEQIDTANTQEELDDITKKSVVKDYEYLEKELKIPTNELVEYEVFTTELVK